MSNYIWHSFFIFFFIIVFSTPRFCPSVCCQHRAAFANPPIALAMCPAPQSYPMVFFFILFFFISFHPLSLFIRPVTRDDCWTWLCASPLCVRQCVSVCVCVSVCSRTMWMESKRQGWTVGKQQQWWRATTTQAIQTRWECRHHKLKHGVCAGVGWLRLVAGVVYNYHQIMEESAGIRVQLLQ